MVVPIRSPKSRLKCVRCLFNHTHELIDMLHDFQSELHAFIDHICKFCSSHRKLCVFIHVVVPPLTDSVRGHFLFIHRASLQCDVFPQILSDEIKLDPTVLATHFFLSSHSLLQEFVLFSLNF